MMVERVVMGYDGESRSRSYRMRARVVHEGVVESLALFIPRVPGSWLLLGDRGILLTEDRKGLVERQDFLAGIRVGDEEKDGQRHKDREQGRYRKKKERAVVSA
jgi:hypothetical protein